LGGLLDIVPASLDILKPGQSYEILRANAGIHGSFGGFGHPILRDGLQLSLQYSDNAVTLHVVETLSGDFNGDGFVDAADYSVWRDGLGDTYELSDYAIWKAHFGANYKGSSSVTSSTVPEPSQFVIVFQVLGLAVAFYRLPVAPGFARQAPNT
jgi:hypothetical protein